MLLTWEHKVEEYVCVYTKRYLDVLHVVGHCLLEMFEIGFDDGFKGIKMGMEVFYIIQ